METEAKGLDANNKISCPIAKLRPPKPIMRKRQPNSAKVEAMLKMELERLKVLADLGHSLKVVWSASENLELSGEVKNDVIFIYEENAEKALETLRHEFIDYIISMAIKPYEKVTAIYSAVVNSVISKLGEEAYQEKEKAVEALVKTLLHPAE
ncbi:MAG: hypothetical protein ABSF44_08745 [Candidatus Bathyarchaeia archaeon]|jgi:hypothetical protein